MDDFTLADLDRICNRSVEKVPVIEWDRWVYVRTISSAERDRFDVLSIKSRSTDETVNLENYTARMVAMCICDADGNPLPMDHEALAAKLGGSGARGTRRIFEVCTRLNGIGKEDVNEAVKNSESEQTSGSGSGSRADSEPEASMN